MPLLASSWSCRLSALALAVVVLGIGAAVSAQPAPARTVLAVHWSSEDFPGVLRSNEAFQRVFRSRGDLRVDFFAEYLESDRLPEEQARQGLREDIRLKFAGRRIDAVIASTTPALEFVLQYRDELFPAAPIVYFGYDDLDEGIRRAGAGVTGVISSAGFRESLALALRLHPSAEQVFVVAGRTLPSSDFPAAVAAALQSFSEWLPLTVVDEPSVEGTLRAVRAAPGRSLVLYVRQSQEEPGAVLYPHEVARLVAQASPVPVYGVADAYLGTGVVGGVMADVEVTAARVAQMVCQILDGARAHDIPIERAALHPIVDWREIWRWGIDTARLPAGTDIRFRRLTVWETYGWYIGGAVLVIALESALIAGLLAQRARRRRVELNLRASESALRRSSEQNRQLAGRLISAQEEERTRIARELHDDLGQRLALLAIDVDLLARGLHGVPNVADRAREVTHLAGDISKSIHDLSHQLHPSRLETLGLAPAVRGLCRELSAHGLDVDFQDDRVPGDVRPDEALCVFRIVQEALHNVVRHSGTTRAEVRLRAGDDALDLEVTDAGRGFDAGAIDGRGIGLIGMRERVRLLGGRLEIQSAAGAGTRVRAVVPLQPHPARGASGVRTRQPEFT